MDLDSVGILIWKRRLITESSNKFRPIKYLKCFIVGTSLVVQWLRLQVPNAGGLSLIPVQGTRLHVLQLKIPYASTNTWHNQRNKYFLKIHSKCSKQGSHLHFLYAPKGPSLPSLISHPTAGLCPHFSLFPHL